MSSDRNDNTEYLDADMRPGDVADILGRLKFSTTGFSTPIRVDAGVRDFLLDAVAARYGGGRYGK